MSKVEGKVALITGASKGIGAHCARVLASRGAKLVLCARSERAGHRVAQLIREAGGDAIFLPTDVGRGEDLREVVDACMSRHGRLDFAFNNAGISGSFRDETARYPLGTWDKVMATNLRGTFLSMQAEIGAMLEGSGGSIINMSSIAGLQGFEKSCAYTASKHAIVGLTKTAALEYADRNIRVNALCPGLIEGEMASETLLVSDEARTELVGRYPMGRIGSAGDVAEAVCWLASDASSFITGATIPVDGGALLGPKR